MLDTSIYHFYSSSQSESRGDENEILGDGVTDSSASPRCADPLLRPVSM